MDNFKSIFMVLLISVTIASAQYNFDFDGNLSSGSIQFEGDNIQYTQGLDGSAILLKPESQSSCSLEEISLDGSHDFSIQFWIKTQSSKPSLILAQKHFANKTLDSQKNPGWALYSSGGTLAWCIGSGDRRINYERENGDKMPLSDGKWHHIAMTYDKDLTEVRLYYDGKNIAIYKVGFEFENQRRLVIGFQNDNFDYANDILPKIKKGRANLQKYVDAFNDLGAGYVEPEEFISLIVDPEELYEEKIKADSKSKVDFNTKNFKKLSEIRKKLYSNPYTVYQNRNLTEIKPVSKLYALINSKVVTSEKIAHEYTRAVQLHPADFSVDQLSINKGALSSQDIRKNYLKYAKVSPGNLARRIDTLTVASWNIWHGGKHWTREKDGWDSRQRIVEILQEKDVDIILMQETYSSGDFIAAELGYYFATTSDWDYCFQGSNISILSRFPLKELFVSPETEFNNVAAKIAISETQEIYAMSNWYGMNSFSKVFNSNQTRFNQSDSIPIFFGGDFNAVPHTDGGESPASRKLIKNGFTDAFRSLHPDVKSNPGYTHRSGRRIDQLYYKGRELKNISTELISTWPGGFPSDHFPIIARFVLN